MRKIQSYNKALEALSILFVGHLLFYAVTLFDTGQRFGILFIYFSLVMAAFKSIGGQTVFNFEKSKSYIFCNIFYIAVAIIAGFHFWTDYMDLIWTRSGDYTTLDITLGAMSIFLVILFTWRAIGPVIPTVVILFMLYALFGQLFPGFLHHSGLSIRRLIEISSVDINGIFGPLTQIAATWIFIFIIFASFIQGFGGLDFIVKISRLLFGKFIWGLPQIAIVSSMSLGALSGSAAANAAGTGSFTIPIMKKYGYPPAFAAAVEALASSGGQIMPPILGAAAFLMADYLGKRYLQIVAMSIAPAVLFYLTLAFGVYLFAIKITKTHTSKDIIPEQTEIIQLTRIDILNACPIVAGIIAIGIPLAVYEMGILISGFCGIMVFLCTQFVCEMIISGGKKDGVRAYFKGVFEGARIATGLGVEIGLMCAALGIIVSCLTATSLGEKISFYSVMYFGHNQLLLMIFTMVICIIFGMAVTTVGAYILTVMLAAPALLKIGLPLEASHFAVFYWSILSCITPPVAGIAIVTARIAGAGFMKTCVEAMKLGFPICLLPFSFFVYPNLLAFSMNTVLPFFKILIGFIAITCALQLSSKGIFGLLKRLGYAVLGFGAIFYPVALVSFLLYIGIIILFVFDLVSSHMHSSSL